MVQIVVLDPTRMEDEMRFRSTTWIVSLSAFLVVSLFSAFPAIGQERTYKIEDERPVGNELVMVFLTSYACSQSKKPEVVKAVRELKLRLDAYADSVGRPFSAVGVSAGWDVEAGIEHLKRYGTFDELISGRSWHNTAAVRYWHREFRAKASTPQIVLTEQTVEMKAGEVIRKADDGTPLREAVTTYGDERLLYRAGSADAIVEWADSDVAIPDENGSFGNEGS